MPHGFKLAVLLAVEQRAMIAEDGEGKGTPFMERHSVFFCEVQIGVDVADVDVDYDKVGLDERLVMLRRAYRDRVPDSHRTSCRQNR